MKSTCVVAAAAILALSMTSCAPKVDTDAEKAAVRDVIDKMKQAMMSEDFESFAALVAHDSDMVNFGTDATERWVGWEALKSSLEQQFASFDDMQMAVRDQVINVGPGGNVAWFSQLVDWDFKAGGEPVSLQGLRVTGVLERRAGKWLFVQMHFSVGVAGQAAEY
jgi:uncharacterized protein (TIGR02246 family)